MNRFYFVLCFLPVFTSGFSQDIPDFTTIDKTTFHYYEAQQWDSLIETGNKALDNNIDYFYLRARMGAAYFATQNFSRALVHFEKAKEFNSTDSYVIESIYHCYKNLNRENDAEYVLHTNPLVFENKVKSGFFKGIYTEGGINNTGDNTSPFFEKHPQGVPWAESDVVRQNTYAGGGFQFSAGKNALINAAYGNLQIKNTRIVLIGPDTLNDNYIIRQNQIYLNSTYRLGKGISIIPSFHYIQVDYQTVFSSFDPVQNKVILDRHSVTLNDFASSLNIVKHYSFYSFSLNGTYSQLNGSKPFQLGINLKTNPFGNLNFYTITGINFQKTKNIKHLVGEQTIGCKIMNHLWLDGFVTLGQLENYVEQNAYVVYNISDLVTFRAGAEAIIPISKFRISLRYSYLKKESFVRTFRPPGSDYIIGPPPDNFTENYFTLTLLYKL